MSTNVHALDLGKTFKRVEARPTRRGRRRRGFSDDHPMGRRRSRAPWVARHPACLVRSFREFFAGYSQDPASILKTTFEEIEGYDEMIVLRGIGFEGHCEHHLVPIVGRAWVAYVPNADQQACQGGGCLCEALADLGENDGTDCKHN